VGELRFVDSIEDEYFFEVAHLNSLWNIVDVYNDNMSDRNIYNENFDADVYMEKFHKIARFYMDNDTNVIGVIQKRTKKDIEDKE